MTHSHAVMAKPAAASGKTLSYLQHTGIATDLTTYTFSSVNLGTASAGRYIICAITGRRPSATTITVSSVTIGGVSATAIVQAENSPNPGSVAAIYVANVPTGATGDVVVTFDSGLVRASIDLWEATGITTTAHDSDSSTADPGTATLDTTAAGILVAVTATGSDTSYTWTNATERYDGRIATGETGSASVADASTSAGTLAVTATSLASPSSTQPVIVLASW